MLHFFFICSSDVEEPLGIYKLSYMWYSATGCFSVIVVGMIITAFTGKHNIRKLNPVLLSPGLHLFKRFIPGLNGLGEDYVSTFFFLI